MARTAHIKVGELRDLVVACKDTDGSAFDLTGVDSIKFRFDLQGTDSEVVEKTGAVKGTATDGNAKYSLLAADWAALSKGAWRVLVKVTKDGGNSVFYFPSRGYLELVIESPLE